MLPILWFNAKPDKDTLPEPSVATVPRANVALTASKTKLASPLKVIVPR